MIRAVTLGHGSYIWTLYKHVWPSLKQKFEVNYVKGKFWLGALCLKTSYIVFSTTVSIRESQQSLCNT